MTTPVLVGLPADRRLLLLDDFRPEKGPVLRCVRPGATKDS
eukprot:CAMPEP_0172457556 /NCGR_PEP_ID=MMETSP1065-20121228/22782_1 /TAXON_ID=265537 /ORGANISM="Amphiprora paludosa, Strain CCMP125" /LENGTH=40 /DNA_ID= /DNA_START= /DNA_END= /DNA_ORIENTATION=